MSNTTTNEKHYAGGLSSSLHTAEQGWQLWTNELMMLLEKGFHEPLNPLLSLVSNDGGTEDQHEKWDL